jgi:hypothetical protein
MLITGDLNVKYGLFMEKFIFKGQFKKSNHRVLTAI